MTTKPPPLLTMVQLRLPRELVRRLNIACVERDEKRRTFVETAIEMRLRQLARH